MEPIIHFLLPVLIILALFPKLDRKLVLILSPLTLISELDFFMGHRFLLHNVFFVFIVLGWIYAIYSKKNLDVKTPVLIAAFFLFSHIVLDLGGPGVGMFYPVYDKLIAIDFSLITSPATGELTKSFSIGTNPLTEATKDQAAPAVTMTGLLWLTVVMLGVAIKLIKNRWFR